MKNYEKYADEIMNIESPTGWCDSFTKPKILEPLGKSCTNTTCGHCTVLTLMWLLEDYKEPEVDWSKVEIDTPILVRDGEDEEWNKQHFAECDGKVVCAWRGGKTSWTEDCVMGWKYAKLAESEDAE